MVLSILERGVCKMINVQNNPVFSSHFKITKEEKKTKNSVSVEGIISQIIEGDGVWNVCVGWCFHNTTRLKIKSHLSRPKKEKGIVGVVFSPSNHPCLQRKQLSGRHGVRVQWSGIARWCCMSAKDPSFYCNCLLIQYFQSSWRLILWS